MKSSGHKVREEALLATRASVSSFAATATDGAVYMLVLALVGVESGMPHATYLGVTALGAACGALANFSLNRWWAFAPSRKPVLLQGAQYLLGSLLTLGILEAVLWILVGQLHVSPWRAWLPAKLIVWVGFSYPFQRILVFRSASQ